jgi:hypothetical protein
VATDGFVDHPHDAWPKDIDTKMPEVSPRISPADYLNAEQAIIEPRKRHGYLLSTSHPIGRFKAVTLHTGDLRAVAGDDLVTVRPAHMRRPDAMARPSTKYLGAPGSKLTTQEARR